MKFVFTHQSSILLYYTRHFNQLKRMSSNVKNLFPYLQLPPNKNNKQRILTGLEIYKLHLLLTNVERYRNIDHYSFIQ